MEIRTVDSFLDYWQKIRARTLRGMLGVDTPPLYGLTSEEVRERSVRP
jgi:hypothetical protein